MTIVKNNSLLAAILAAVFCLTIPAMAIGQDNIGSRTQSDTISKLRAAPTIEKRFVFVYRSCGELYPYYPNIEYVWIPRLFVPVPELPGSVLEQYTRAKTLYENQKLPSMVEIEEVDGIKIIKKETDNEFREEHLQAAEGGAEAHRRGE